MSKQLVHTTLLLFIACVSVFIVALSTVQAASERYTVTLTKQLSQSDLQALIKKEQLKITDLHFIQGDFEGGYTLQADETIDQALASLVKFHKEFLDVSLEANSNDKKLNPGEDFPRYEVLEQQLIRSKELTQSGIFQIDEISTDEPGTVEKLKKLGYVKEVKSKGISKKQEITVQSSTHESWAPYGGTSDVQKSYTRQTFYFNKISDFGSTSTYEHETQVYDKNFANYAGYWSSNMPKAYYDTPFLDSIDNFTIGTLTANALKVNYQYLTYMSLKPGTASTATVRIKGQKGHRSPSSCYSTWCVFADATTGTMALLSAPSGKSWVY